MQTAARLHAPRGEPLAGSGHLLRNGFASWRQPREPTAAFSSRCAEMAEALLRDQREIVVLHGDLHHDNVLDFGERGWLAIDPKHIVGDRGFDFANIFTNPDLADPTRPVATEPRRFARRLDIVAEAGEARSTPPAFLDPCLDRLSAAWFLGDGDPMAEIDLHIARLAAAELDRMS